MYKGVWTETEIAYLKKYGATIPRSELARRLGRESSSLCKFMKRHNLPVYEGRYRKWTKHEVAQLYDLVEKLDLREISKELNRTTASVFKKIQALRMRVRANVYSMESAAKETGYHQYQLKRARDALHQKWKLRVYQSPGRSGRMMRYTITPLQLTRLCEYLKTESPQQRAA